MLGLAGKLRGFFKKAGKRKAVVGVSGGVDSALVLWLCCKALGASNVYAYHLPYRNRDAEGRDAKALAKKLGAHYDAVYIRKAADALFKASGTKDRVGKGNIMARIRMILLYDFARQHDAIVVGTGNRSELSVGYFTKHGDGATDVLPIGGLYKTDVWVFAKEAGLPPSIINRAPTAGLWEGQTDEGELGLKYAELDGILRLLEKGNKGSRAEAAKRFGKAKTEKVERMRLAALHKLKPAPVL